MSDQHDRNNTDEHRERPDPQEDPETSTIGSTDERSSENRREGLRKDGEDVDSRSED
jgi:hypothetical protein